MQRLTALSVVSLALAAGCAGGLAFDDSGASPAGGSPRGGAPGASSASGFPTGGSAMGGATGESNAGDRYRAVGTNPFVATKHDPFSTFAADVDTASYDIFRRDVNLGMLPQPASVRLEEYVNYFSYQYAAPAAGDEHPFMISLAAADNVFGRGTALLRVGIQATKPPPFQKRPANVVFLVDVSGSMLTADKLPLVKKVLTQTLDVVDPTDKISVVTYASGTAVRLPPTPAAERARIAAVINGLQGGGSTNGAGGLALAYEQAQSGFIQGGINHIVLCTDGDFNVGPSSTTELLRIIEEKRKTGITLTVLGFGIGNLNDDMMETVSNAGNGIYGVISSEEQASRYVRERMLDTLVQVAKDMKIQVEFNPDRVTAYRLLGYENRAIADQDFRNDGVDAGEVGAGHRVTALYEIVLSGQMIPQGAGRPALVDGEPSQLRPEASGADLVLVKVRYKAPNATATTPAREVRSALPHAAVGESLAGADDDLRWAAAVAAWAEILKQSPYADRALLPQIEAIAKAQAARDADRKEFADLFARAKSKLPATVR